MMPNKKALPQFNRTHISRVDFEEAESYLKILVPTFHGMVIDNEHIRRALLTAAIVAYSRPFSGNKDHPNAVGHPPLYAPKVLKDDCEYIELHERILTLRNTVIAHSVFDAKPVSKYEAIPGGFKVEEERFDVLAVQIDVDRFRGLCISMHRYCLSKQFELSDQING